MMQTPPETRDYRETDPVRVLERISDQLAGIQGSLDRLELGAAEFVPAVRDLLGKRATRAAASAAGIFRRGPG